MKGRGRRQHQCFIQAAYKMQCKPFWRFSASVHMRGRFLWRAPMLCVHPLCCLLSAFKEMSSLVFNFGIFLNYITRTSLHLRAASFASSATIACTPLKGSHAKMALRLQDVCLLALLTMHSFFNIRPPSPPLPGRTLSLSGYCCNLKGKLLCRRIADASAAICLHLVSDASHGVASKLYLENDVIQSPFFC